MIKGDMMSYRGFEIRLYPNMVQRASLEQHFNCCRFVYNHMIVINQKKYKRTGKVLSGYDMQAYLPKIKKQYPWLAEVNSHALQIVCQNLGVAFTRFCKKESQYPCFKKKNGKSSFSFIQNSYIKGNKIKLPKLGLIKFRCGDMPVGKIKRITVKKISNKYYASLLFVVADEPTQNHNFEEITGIDLGLIDLVVTSNGQRFVANKFMKKSRANIRKASKALSRAKKGSARRIKTRAKFSNCHEKVKNQRKDANHKITRILISDSDNQALAVESLNVKGMMANRKLSAAIADAGWSQFLTFLTYKAQEVGKPVVQVDRFYPSSKTCSYCGFVNRELKLSQRTWICSCGEKHDRDINAAINIALEAARNAARGVNVRPRLALANAGEANACLGMIPKFKAERQFFKPNQQGE